MIGLVVRHQKRSVLLAAGLIAVALPVLGQGASAPAGRPTFDVASIKLNKSGGRMTRLSTANDRFAATNNSLKMLIDYAYNLKTDGLISGLPGWADSARFDIEAKVDEDTLAALKKLPEEERTGQRRLMVQTLLADRFHLRVHRVSKELPIYELVVAKGGFKLKDADPKNTYPSGIKGPDGVSHGGMMFSDGKHLKAQAVPISGLVNFLSRHLQREVVDKTGLTGKYDFTIELSQEVNGTPAEQGGQQDVSAMDDSGPSIFTALQEQLGLKLDSTKGPVDTIMVDHVEMPSEN